MIAKPDLRSILNAFFRHRRKFMVFFLPPLLLGIIYVSFLATPEYESTARLLVKFGGNARPEISRADGPAGDFSSADEHREIIQSNATILTSRDLAESLLKDVSIERAYPRIAHNPPGRGTVMDAAVKHFADDLGTKTENESDIINVGLYNPDPETAQVMLRHLLELFVARQSEIYSNPQTAALHDQADAAQKKLESAQKRLYDYKSQAGIASVEEELTLLLRQRNDLEEERLDKERSYAHYRAVLTKNKPQNPDVQALADQLNALDGKISDTAQRKAKFDDLAREVQLDEENYKGTQTRLQEAEANQGLNQQKITQISVIDQPTLPYRPSRPWKGVILVICIFAGLAFGISACLAAEGLDQSFSLPEQAGAGLGIPVLATFSYRLIPNGPYPPNRGKTIA